MDSGRAGSGELLAGAGGLLLLLVMFLPWLGVDASFTLPGSSRPITVDDRSLNAWGSLSGEDLLLAATALLGLALLVVPAKRRAPLALVVLGAAALSALAIVLRLIYPPDFPLVEADGTTFEAARRVGAFLGLVCTAAIALGANRATTAATAAMPSAAPEPARPRPAPAAPPPAPASGEPAAPAAARSPASGNSAAPARAPAPASAESPASVRAESPASAHTAPPTEPPPVTPGGTAPAASPAPPPGDGARAASKPTAPAPPTPVASAPASPARASSGPASPAPASTGPASTGPASPAPASPAPASPAPASTEPGGPARAPRAPARPPRTPTPRVPVVPRPPTPGSANRARTAGNSSGPEPAKHPSARRAPATRAPVAPKPPTALPAERSTPAPMAAPETPATPAPSPLQAWPREAIETQAARAWRSYDRQLGKRYAGYFDRHPRLRGGQRFSARDLEAALPPGWDELAGAAPKDAWQRNHTSGKSTQTLAIGLLGVAARRDPSLGWLTQAFQLPAANGATIEFEHSVAATTLGERSRQTHIDALVESPEAVICIATKWREAGIDACACRGKGVGPRGGRCSRAVEGCAPYWWTATELFGLAPREPGAPCPISTAHEAVRTAAATHALAGPDRLGVLALIYDAENPYFAGAGDWPGWPAALAAAAGANADPRRFRFAAVSWQELTPRLPLDDRTRTWAREKHGLG